MKWPGVEEGKQTQGGMADGGGGWGRELIMKSLYLFGCLKLSIIKKLKKLPWLA